MTGKSSDDLPGDAEADPVLVELGQRLLRARLRYGERMNPPKSVSQAAVARLLDVTGVTIGAWEAGKNDPGVPMLLKLAALYGVNDVWLLTGKGSMYPDEEGGGNVRPNGSPHRPVAPTEFTDNRLPMEPLRGERAKGKPVKRKPGRSAVA